MECKFTVGQKIVCVNDDSDAFMIPGVNYRKEGGLDGLTKGQIYTVRSIFMNPRTGNINVELEEITRPSYLESNDEIRADSRLWKGYVHMRFAPLKEKKKDISVFTEILNKVNDGNHDNNYGFGLDELFETVKK
jgi:hypothetical protein